MLRDTFCMCYGYTKQLKFLKQGHQYHQQHYLSSTEAVRYNVGLSNVSPQGNDGIKLTYCEGFSLALTVCRLRAISFVSSECVNLISLFPCDDTLFKLESFLTTD